MTTPPDKPQPPREFYIDSFGDSWEEQAPSGEFIHVIEKSAYDALAARLAGLQRAVGYLVMGLNMHEKYGKPVNAAEAITEAIKMLKEAYAKSKGGAK